MTFEIEITRFAPEPVTERITSATPGEAAERIQPAGASEFVVFVAALDRERKLDWGNFYLWCNPERALIELHEHCEHFATDPRLQPGGGRDVSFRDEDGSTFSVPFRQTVSRDQAIAALRFWLPDQQHTPDLVWT